MKYRKAIIPLLFVTFILWGNSDADACTVCHSKNPKMVRMHEELGYKDCFLCHGPTAKKSGDPPEKQMMNDERCVRCHMHSNATSAQPKSDP